MLGKLKFLPQGWRLYFYILLGIIVGVLLVNSWIIGPRNAELCEVFFEDEFKCQDAKKYSLRSETCFCEDGDFILTAEMIQEKNDERRRLYELRINASRNKPIVLINMSQVFDDINNS